MKAKFGIHWFRQDLRIENNPSLISLSEKVQQVIPIYIFDTNQRILKGFYFREDEIIKEISDLFRDDKKFKKIKIKQLKN